MTDNPALIAQSLESAARLLRAGNRPDTAAWRLADAGLRLRMLLEDEGMHDCVGLDRPTLAGAVLPQIPANLHCTWLVFFEGIEPVLRSYQEPVCCERVLIEHAAALAALPVIEAATI